MTDVISPENISGFTVGEGCFYVEYGKDSKYKLGLRVRPSFVIEVVADDEPVLQAIKEIIGCGTVYHLDFGRYEKYRQKNWKKHVRYKVSNTTDIADKLVPFFAKHPLFGKKARAFSLFKMIVQKVLDKKHLDKDGLEEISKLVDQLHSVNKRGV
ncbi:MAG: hypothetical protein A3B94_01220 [Candidatus Jacksonbacteria bacterium RIFCSPHIGHO2_02_FULL_43_10]|nr:MAG: hypothetical protein A3B94_01220 [Candidatus Jacksonbacteria bacterium RIFCSPHIGHO2_02_FULL_43_10]